MVFGHAGRLLMRGSSAMLPVARVAGSVAIVGGAASAHTEGASTNLPLAIAAGVLGYAAFASTTSTGGVEERLASLEVKAAKSESSAFVFIKPHAVTDKVETLVRSTFEKAGIKVVAEGDISGKTIDEKMYIDTHYGAIAAKAVKLKPSELHPSPKALKAFEKAFGMSWATALSKGLVYNAADGCTKLGCDGDGMDAKWATLKRDVNLIKFGGGFYCGQVDGIFVMNGFYMAMRGKFTDPASKIHYLLVEWPTDKLSWSDFRGSVLGATNPKDAAKGSLRRSVFEDWKSLGLTAEPDTGDNGLHASASPFEAMAERTNWCGAKLESDTFGKGLLGAGIPKKTIVAWAEDPQVCGASLFDSLEDLDSDKCLEKAAALYASSTKK